MGTVLKRMSKHVLTGRARREAIVAAHNARVARGLAKLDRQAKDELDREQAKRYGSRRFQKRVYRAAQAYASAGTVPPKGMMERYGRSALAFHGADGYIGTVEAGGRIIAGVVSAKPERAE